MLLSDLALKLAERTSPENAECMLSAIKNNRLLSKLSFLKDGLNASVFDIENGGGVFKLFDQRTRKNPRICNSRFLLDHYGLHTLSDKQGADLVLEIQPKLTPQGVTTLHQEMLRYKLWTEEGRDFWDILPSPRNSREVKNVLLDHRGVPYVHDEDAVKPFIDSYNEYPPDAWGKRTDQQYREYRRDSFDAHGRSDVISDSQFAEIKKACEHCEWPLMQRTLFDSFVDHDAIEAFQEVCRALSPVAVIHR